MGAAEEGAAEEGAALLVGAAAELGSTDEAAASEVGAAEAIDGESGSEEVMGSSKEAMSAECHGLL